MAGKIPRVECVFVGEGKTHQNAKVRRNGVLKGVSK